MREILGNVYQFVRSLTGDSLGMVESLQESVHRSETAQHLSVNRAFGRLALRQYQNGDPSGDYEHILLDLKNDMHERGLKVGALNLSDQEAEQLRNITGLE